MRVHGHDMLLSAHRKCFELEPAVKADFRNQSRDLVGMSRHIQGPRLPVTRHAIISTGESDDYSCARDSGEAG